MAQCGVMKNPLHGDHQTEICLEMNEKVRTRTLGSISALLGCEPSSKIDTNCDEVTETNSVVLTTLCSGTKNSDDHTVMSQLIWTNF